MEKETGRCVFCYKDCSLEEWRQSINKMNHFGLDDCEGIKNQLPNIFLLRKFLEIPQEKCSEILQGHGNPNLWLFWCASCSHLIEEANELFIQIQTLQKQYENIREKALNEIVNSQQELQSSCSPTKRRKEEKSDCPTEIVRSYIIHERELPPVLSVELKGEQIDIDHNLTFSEAELMDVFNESNIVQQPTGEDNPEFSTLLEEENLTSHCNEEDVPKLMKSLIEQNKSLMTSVSRLNTQMNGVQEKNSLIFNLLHENRERPHSTQKSFPGPASKTVRVDGEAYRKGHFRSIDNTKKKTDIPFTTTRVDDTEITIYLPENLESSLRAATRRSTMVTNLLRHFHSIKFLRSCTLSGTSLKGNRDGSVVIALPSRTVESIIAVVRKLSPSKLLSKLPKDCLEYKAVEIADVNEIKNLIRKSLQYFKGVYDNEGYLIHKSKM